MKTYNKERLNLLTDENFNEIAKKIFNSSQDFIIDPVELSHNRGVKKLYFNNLPFYLKVPDNRFPQSHVHSEVIGNMLASELGILTTSIHSFGNYNINGEILPYILTKEIKGIPLKNGKSLEWNEIEQILNLIKLLHSKTSDTFGVVTDLDDSYLEYNDYFSFINDAFLYALNKNQFNLHLKLKNRILDLHYKHGQNIFKKIKKFHFSHKDLNFKNILRVNNTFAFIDWEWSLYLDNETDYAIFLVSILLDIRNVNLYQETYSFIINNKICDEKILKFHLGREIIFHLAFSKRDDRMKDVEFFDLLELSLKFFLEI